jgi:hypothetical protein
MIATVLILQLAAVPPLPGQAEPQTSAFASAAACTCDVARETNGWCEAHQVGYLGPIEVESFKLHEALDAHGHVMDPQSMECAACREAFATGGFCEEHRIGFVGGLGYFSPLTYHLARGQRRELAEIDCPVCRRNALDQGWCETCQTGMVGNVAIAGRESWERVERALARLRAAIEVSSRCEICATALALDGYCPLCQIWYKDGKAVPPPPPAPAPAAAEAPLSPRSR